MANTVFIVDVKRSSKRSLVLLCIIVKMSFLLQDGLRMTFGEPAELCFLAWVALMWLGNQFWGTVGLASKESMICTDMKMIVKSGFSDGLIGSMS